MKQILILICRYIRQIFINIICREYFVVFESKETRSWRLIRYAFFHCSGATIEKVLVDIEQKFKGEKFSITHIQRIR